MSIGGGGDSQHFDPPFLCPRKNKFGNIILLSLYLWKQFKMNKAKTHDILVRGVSKKTKNLLKKTAKGKRLSVNSFMLYLIEMNINHPNVFPLPQPNNREQENYLEAKY